MSEYLYPRNFSRAELIMSATAQRKGIANTPSNKQVEINLVNLAYWLQELRNRLSKHYGRDVAIKVTSGFRSEELNVAVAGSKRSAHMVGLAADIVVTRLSPKEVLLFIHNHCCDVPFDQCIDEFGRWVHIGIERPRTQEKRREFLVAMRDKTGRVVYQTPSYIEAIQ